MSDKQLSSFKVGAKQPSALRTSPTKAANKAQEPTAEQNTLGFARIEEILDKEQPKELQQALGALADKLDAIVDGQAPAKEKGNAKRAKLAVTKTVDLLAMLFATKQKMLTDYQQHKAKADAGKAPAKGKPKQGGR